MTSGHAFQIFRCDDNSMQSFVGHVSCFAISRNVLTNSDFWLCLFCLQGERNICLGNWCNRSLCRVSWQQRNHKYLGRHSCKVCSEFQSKLTLTLILSLFRSKFPHPIRTIYEPYNEQRKLSKVALSPDGRNIVTASGGKASLIKLFQWSSSTTAEASSGIELSKRHRWHKV